MSEEEINEAMQYNLDYTEAMLSDELFGTNEVAEVKLLASEKAIKDLQQKVEQLEAELNLYKDNHEHLNNQIEQLENIRKEAIEYIKNNKETREHYEPYGTPMGNPNYTTTHIFGYYELLDILNKGSNKE